MSWLKPAAPSNKTSVHDKGSNIYTKKNPKKKDYSQVLYFVYNLGKASTRSAKSLKEI
jgi:hypothetical protein